NRRDAENYLARLRDVAGQIDVGIARAKDAASRGFLMPDFITRAAIGQFDRLLEKASAERVLVPSLAERAAKVQELGEGDRQALVAYGEKIAREPIFPAFGRARALLQQQLPETGSDAGLWRVERGAEAYACALGFFTTVPLDAREVHQTGLFEVA